MKITDDNKFVEHEVDIIQKIEEFKEKYHTVYWTHIHGQIYVYIPLGRRDHKEIVQDEALDDVSKEDEVVRRCLLYPEDFDIDNSTAGIVSKLLSTIIDNSHLKSIEIRTQVMDYYRSEMFDLQEQITCIINEAFPQYDIEEIENWGIDRTAKYLSRAEWKLQNFRGATFNYEAIEQMQQQEQEQQETKESDDDNLSQSSQKPNNSKDTKKKEKMTPDKLAEMKRKFPEINWDADVIANEGISGMKDAVDSTSVALRVGGH